MIAQPFPLIAEYVGYVVDQDCVATTIAAGSNGAVLPQGTINVASAASFAAAGIAAIFTTGGVQYVVYAGKTGTTLTGCTGGTTAMTTGDSVREVRTAAFGCPGDQTEFWFRTYLCPSAGAGTSSADSAEFLLHVRTKLRAANTRYLVTMRADAKVRIQYTGTGTATIYLPSMIATLLGHSTALSLVSGGVDYVDGVRNPTHCIFSHWREAPNGWTGEQVGAAMSEMDNGVVDFLGGTYHKIKRAFGLRGHPYTPTDATALSLNAATAMYPDRILHDPKWIAPTLAPTTAAVSYSIHQFLATSKGYELGYTFGEFADLVSGAATYFDEGYWSLTTLKSMVRITVGGWIQLNDRTELELTCTAHTVIT